MTSLNKTSVAGLIIAFAAMFSGCDQTQFDITETTTTHVPRPQLSVTPFIARTNTLGYQLTSQASQKARELDSKIQNYLREPNPESLAASKQAWLMAYQHYLSSSVFAYINFQDNEDLKRQRLDYRSLTSSIDAWPIAGGYIDYVSGYPFSGIVNDLTLAIGEEDIRLQHGFADASYASTGFHPLAFMLWGEQGQRLPNDYLLQENTRELEIVSEGGDEASNEEPEIAESQSTEAIAINETPETDKPTATEPSTAEPIVTEQVAKAENIAVVEERKIKFVPQNNKRRRTYLKLLATLLVDDLERIRGRWEPSKGYYSQLLQANQNNTTLLAILTAIENVLTRELIVKRLSVSEDHYAASSRQDALAIITGLKMWLVAEEDNSIVKNDFISLYKQVDAMAADLFLQTFNQLDSCYQNLATPEQLEQPLDASSFEQCKKLTNDLLALFKQAKEKINNFSMLGQYQLDQ